MPRSIDSTVLERGGVRLDVDGPRASITLDRPASSNAQTPSTWQALKAIGEGLDPEVLVVVVRGSGSDFSTGLDRRMLAGGIPGETDIAGIAGLGPQDGADVIAEFQAGFRWLRDPDRVTIAAVSGSAVGAGFHLALACDIRVVAEDAAFVMPEASFGLVPDLGGTLPLVRTVGYARAAEICVTGRPVAAPEALRIGLANSVVPVDELGSHADELARSITQSMPGAVRETLALLDAAAAGNAADEQVESERSAQLRRLTELAALARQSN
ncbi:Carnitinyl-CoA dehydratase [Streptomyces sp. YIM 130001]|uniref:enoyl-CoA hydratase/isomerase family protein n=1 Tax=Streptomyces sp. YIM 130001 TaxID=2259644 RepID=UPI000E6476B0|nr:enoyl-CoA hydratase/isomerase family protein [Streptomyces sp. YIM 130001]RII20499.1 Carnitinyl-CoA dehydratase [Streptomyces sp. YIM 130001]